MKFLALLFIVFFTPTTILLMTLLHGGFSTVVLKQELQKSNVYEKMSDTIHDSTNDQGSYQEDKIFSVIQDRLTPAYLQTKAEGAIDDSSKWITGTSTTPPVLSFKDIKEEILTQNPELMQTLTELSQAAKDMPSESPTENGEEQSFDQTEMIASFAKNDFSFPLKDGLIGIKGAYKALSITLPVLLVLLLLNIMSLLYFAKTWPSRLRWLGATFILTAIHSYIVAFASQSISSLALSALVEQKNAIVAIVYPITERLTIIFVTQHKAYQMPVTIGLLAVGVVCLVLSFVMKTEKVNTNKPLPKQKKSK